MILFAAILKITSYRKFNPISGHTIVFLDLKIMGVVTKILSLAMIEAEIWVKYDFAGEHFENDVIQEVHPNFVAVASFFHEWEGLRSKLKQVSYCPGQGCTRFKMAAILKNWN